VVSALEEELSCITSTFLCFQNYAMWILMWSTVF
jgi:hypothetical protein